jgi:hypothetical protein
MLRTSLPGNPRKLIPFFAMWALGVFTSTRADAHFKLTAPACWLSQDASGGPQKNGPCAAVPNTGLGDVAGTPTRMVTAFSPGQTISVSVSATIAHPGWWRIALVEGPSSTQTLMTLPDPRAQAGTNCTPAIMTNPVWSPTQPILADGLPAGSVASTNQSGSKTFQVTIPQNASCTTARPCTLQVIMVMTDHPANDCYYHHCADITTGASSDAGSNDSSSTGGSDASASHDAPVSSDGSGSSGPGAGGSSGSGGAGSGSGGEAGTGGTTSGAAGSGSVTTGGTTTSGATGSSGSGGGNSTTTMGAGGDTTSAQPNAGSSDAGCSCILSSRDQTTGGYAAVALLALVATQRRRQSNRLGRRG